jgi:hypothetical protein
MSEPTAEEVVSWLDRDLLEAERVEDRTAEFNVAARVSGLVVHVVRREPGGAIQVGQRIEFDEEIREGIRALDDSDRDELVARIREALMGEPIVYAFQDEDDQNVAFRDVHTILIERRLYGEVGPQALMDAVITVWKALRYLDDLPRLVGVADA